MLILKGSFTYALCVCVFVCCFCVWALLFYSGVAFFWWFWIVIYAMICLIMKILYNTVVCCYTFKNYTHSLITFFLRMFMFLRVEAFDCLLMIIIKRKGKATFLLMIKNWLKLRILFMFLCSQKSMVLVICKWYQTKGFK